MDKHQLRGIHPNGYKGFLSDETFILASSGTATRLNKLLGATNMLPPRPYQGPLGKQFRAVMEYHRAGNRYLRDWEAYRIGVLAAELALLSEIDPAAFAAFKKLIKRATQNEYFGLRFEIFVAAALTRKGINYSKQESPDYDVSNPAGKAYIECTSANLIAPKLGELLYKLKSAIADKGRKSYANSSTVLFVDFTNILFNSAVVGSPMNVEEAGTAAEEEFRNTSFGALFTYVLVPRFGESSICRWWGCIRQRCRFRGTRSFRR